MLTPQANTFGLVLLGYSNLLPPIIRQAITHSAVHTALHNTVRAEYMTG